MKKFIWFCLFMAGCSQKDMPAPNEDVDVLHQRFHGKYEIVSSTSNEPVDINLDGRSSTDMFQEYPYLLENNLRIDIYGPNKYNTKRVFLFDQMWPEQYLRIPSGLDWQGQLLDYEPGATVDFAEQPATRAFTFSPDVKQLVVIPSTDATEKSFRWQRPESATVEGDDYIRTINKRRLYTRAGVKDVLITTLYKRYTMTT